VLGSIPTDDIGADLCLFGVSFNTTTLLVSTVSSAFKVGLKNPELANKFVAIAVTALVISLILYVFSLILIAPSRRKSYPRFIQMLRKKSWRVKFTVIIGFFALAIQIAIYVSTF
jgi:succinate dehydrogenase hydrophobic anchor subunit